MRKKKIWTIVAVSLWSVLYWSLLIVVGIAVYKSQLSIQFQLEGDASVHLEYGQTYEEPGVKAYLVGRFLPLKPMELDVHMESSVDESTLGAYLVRYRAAWHDLTDITYRQVNVADTQAPQITLVADPDKFTFPNETYQEEGFTATDNYDGDITDRVQRTETKESVTYTVTDASGNTAEVSRPIVYDDPIPPELILKGDSTVTLTVGQGYKEPGYTAKDNCDGDLTGKVSVSGKIDIYRTGTYTLKYTVKDAYNNEATATRTVKVEFRPTDNWELPADVVPNGKVIYLTFDDGPGKDTPRLLDILNKYNVKATFFVVNTHYIETIGRAAQEGHTIAIHTASHVFKDIYASEEAYFADLHKMQDIIKTHTGQTAMLVRFPGGSSNTISKFNSGIMTRLTALVGEQGFRYFDWNVDSKDAGGAKSASQVFQNVIEGIQKHQNSVVLQHDIKGYSIDAVEQIIMWGLENGYTFEALTPDSPECHHLVRN